MTFSDIKISDLNNREDSGPIALKNYLQYAANGGGEVPDNNLGEPDSDFERAVGTFLKSQDFIARNGFSVNYQVGASSYFIDIVIDSPSGEHLIGIECDGAQYHSSKSARDRDKLRQAQVERLGWKIYRVWSTDWFHNRALSEKKLLEAVKKACSLS